MNWVVQSLQHHWRYHLSLALAVSLACAVLVSGLMVGDSLSDALKTRTEQRVGPIDHRLSLEGRWLNEDYVDRLADASPADIAPLFTVGASAKGSDDRVAAAQIIAADERLWELSGVAAGVEPGGVILNAALAAALNVTTGDPVIFRFERPGAIPSESALRSDDALTSLRLTVTAIRGGAWPFEMDLFSSGQTPLNAFISLDELDTRLGWRPLNTILFDCDCSLDTINASIAQAWRYTDAQVSLTDEPFGAELRSDRVLIDPAIASAALSLAPEARSIASWFVDSGKGPSGQASYFFATADVGGSHPLSEGLKPAEIAISTGLASRLGADIGDQVSLRFPVLGARQRLDYSEANFTVRRLYTMGEGGTDSSLMPSIPGMAQADSCADWDAGLPIDLNRIVPADEVFWSRHGGAPRVILSMDAAQSLWATPYGTLTSIRFSPEADHNALSIGLQSALQPKQFGFFAEAVGDRMASASEPINDFGQLFLGFNFFLLLAALFLMALFSGLAMEQRRRQQGVLMALGFTQSQVQRLLLLEFGVVSAVGCLLGLVGAVALTSLMLNGLMGTWRDAVGAIQLPLRVNTATLMMGAGIAWLASMGASWWSIRTTLAGGAWFNLRGDAVSIEGVSGSVWTGLRWMAWAPIVVATAIAMQSEAAHGPTAAMVFFGCGALVLLGCLTGVWAWLRAPSTASPTRLGVVGAAGLRVRPKSSFAVVCAVAVGLFLVGGIGGGTLQPQVDPADPQSGTGGFNWVAQTAVPVQADLSTADGLAAHGLDQILKPGDLLGLSVLAGDDASCMNLGSAQMPRLMGIDPTDLVEHNRFRFVEPTAETWSVLTSKETDSIPVVGDAATIYWGLHLSIGDTIEMLDEHGKPLRLRIAGVVENWVLQGSLVADRAQLADRFPSNKGDRTFLVYADADKNTAAATIERQLTDYGVRLQHTDTVLDGYQRVERTYMLIFGALGGVGVALAVLGVIVLFFRRTVETSRDVALLHALGFTEGRARQVGLFEMATLLLTGVACGVMATVVSLLPRLMAFEWTALFLFLILVAAISAVATAGVAVVSLTAGRRGQTMAIHRHQ